MTDQRPPMGPRELTCDEVRDLAAGFVLDALQPDEAAAVRAHLATCADPHAEMAELASVLPVLAESAPVAEPLDALKGRILAAAAAADVESARPVAAAPTEASPRATEPIPLRTAGTAAPVLTSRVSWALGIAAMLAIVVLGGWNLLLRSELDQARTYGQSVAAVLDAAAEPGARTAILTAEGGAGPSGLAAVGADGSVTLAMQSLAPTSGTEVYEAWVIGGDGVPVALGGFQVGNAGTAYFESAGVPAEAGVVLALTREPGPGATTPTLPIVSSGAAG